MSTTVSLQSAILRGIEAVPITVEVSLSGGIPGISIVGSADSAIHESRLRIRSACNESGFSIPRKHITVNLSPSEIKKSGTALDLPIALAILLASGQISNECLESCLIVGELGLHGNILDVRGLLAYARLARDLGCSLLTATNKNYELIDTFDIVHLSHLRDMRDGIVKLKSTPHNHVYYKQTVHEPAKNVLDYADVIDQEIAKRAFVIAAAGNHGLLMMGPPGSGKTMLAKRMTTILPPLTHKEQETSILLHSVAGQSTKSIAQGHRPFRAPHHSISKGGLLGGGRPVIPGEVSLAHGGVLFLDELPEFNKDVLQSLRQPLEDHEIRLVRVDGVYIFPSKFQLIAAANPCPCGYFGDPANKCVCSLSKIVAYQSKIGGPLLDRIDMHIDVKRPSSKRIINHAIGLSSAQMADIVAQGRAFSSWRTKDLASKYPKKLDELKFSPRSLSLLESISNRMNIGARSLMRLALVARTIADLNEADSISEEHVLEASSFRPRTNEVEDV